MKRTLILLAITLLSLALFTACTSNADTMPQNSPNTSTSPGTSPSGTDGAGGMQSSGTDQAGGMTGTDGTGMGTGMGIGSDTGSGMGSGMGSGTGSGMGSGTGTTDTMSNGGVNTVEDSLRISDEISEEVEKLSELDKAEAVVAGNIALVAVVYDDQYQGGLTDRLKDMVTERVETIDKAITSVHVTDSQDTVTMISGLREKLKSSDLTFEQLQTQLLDIGSSIAGGGTPEVSQPQSNTGA